MIKTYKQHLILRTHKTLIYKHLKYHLIELVIFLVLIVILLLAHHG